MLVIFCIHSGITVPCPSGPWWCSSTRSSPSVRPALSSHSTRRSASPGWHWQPPACAPSPGRMPDGRSGSAWWPSHSAGSHFQRSLQLHILHHNLHRVHPQNRILHQNHILHHILHRILHHVFLRVWIAAWRKRCGCFHLGHLHRRCRLSVERP